jgi:hypothetical protein
MKYVVATAQCFQNNGDFVTSDWGAIEYQPILPGQTSPYAVLVRYNPAIHTCAVSFKYLSGGNISAIGPDWPKHKT